MKHILKHLTPGIHYLQSLIVYGEGRIGTILSVVALNNLDNPTTTIVETILESDRDYTTSPDETTIMQMTIIYRVAAVLKKEEVEMEEKHQ